MLADILDNEPLLLKNDIKDILKTVPHICNNQFIDFYQKVAFLENMTLLVCANKQSIGEEDIHLLNNLTERIIQNMQDLETQLVPGWLDSDEEPEPYKKLVESLGSIDE